MIKIMIRIRIGVLVIFIINLLIAGVFFALVVLLSFVPLRCVIIKIQVVLYKDTRSRISNVRDISRNCIEPSVVCLWLAPRLLISSTPVR